MTDTDKPLLDPMPRKDLTLPPPVGYVSRATAEAEKKAAVEVEREACAELQNEIHLGPEFLNAKAVFLDRQAAALNALGPDSDPPLTPEATLKTKEAAKRMRKMARQYAQAAIRARGDQT